MACAVQNETILMITVNWKMLVCKNFLIISSLALLCFLPSAVYAAQKAEADANAQQLLRQGLYRQAVQQWRDLLTAGSDLEPVTRAVINQRMSQVLLALGQLREAQDALLEAGKYAKKSNDRQLQYRITADLANVHIRQGNLKLAKNLLDKALEYFVLKNNYAMQAAVLNDQGRLLWRQGDLPAAEKMLLESYELAEARDLQHQQVRSRLNHALLLLELKRYGSLTDVLREVGELIQGLPDTLEKQVYLLRIGELSMFLANDTGNRSQPLFDSAYARLTEVHTLAKQSKHYRHVAYSLGLLAQLYIMANQLDEAEKLYNRATFIAQQYNFPEQTYRWYWYAGRLQRTKGNFIKAIEFYEGAHHAYQKVNPLVAFETLDAERHMDKASDFFYEMADLILRISSGETDKKNLRTLLSNAVNIVENLKNTELQDYFKDNCVALARQRYANDKAYRDKTAASLYVIAFDDRLELIIHYGDDIRRYTQNVTKDVVLQVVSEFRNKIERRRGRDYINASKKLYDWIIKPFEQDMRKKDITTLVVVPDVSLRALPFAALHNGKRFFVEDFMLAISPGIELTNAQPSSRQNLSIVLGGIVHSVQGYPALNYVESELKGIHKVLGGDMLINKDFTRDNINKTLASDQYSIAHIASHGEFSGNVNKSFILTYDDKISVGDIAQYIGASRFQQQPIELLTLSACYTAAGDEKAMLGLAGITVKSGARSALATLWPVNDLATAKLMTEFYTQLKNTAHSKARALQLAQKKLLKDKRYRHPGYWSPFILIGNWL